MNDFWNIYVEGEYDEDGDPRNNEPLETEKAREFMRELYGDYKTGKLIGAYGAYNPEEENIKIIAYPLKNSPIEYKMVLRSYDVGKRWIIKAGEITEYDL